MRLITKVALILISTTLALAAAEIIIRVVRPQVPLGKFEQRYEVDDRASAIPGYFTNDPILPFRLRRNFHHRVADTMWAPSAFDIRTDAHGFRNADGNLAKARIVLVGDSVVFGFGAGEAWTLSSNLAKALDEPVYNLGIPGAGPEGYLVMLRRYLQDANPNLIVVGFYRGNDAHELSLASWKELVGCGPPASKIHRSDYVPYAPVYPTWVANSFLKHSHLAAAAVSVATMPRFELSDREFISLHGLLSVNAAGALEELHATQKDRDDVEKKGIEFANSILATATCLKASERSVIQAYLRHIAAHNRTAALLDAQQVSRDVIASGCSPIDPKTLVNGAIMFRFYATIEPNRQGRIAEGDLLVYRNLLQTLRAQPSFQYVRAEIDAVQNELAMRTATAAAKIRTLHQHLLDARAPVKETSSCDKTELFLSEAARLAARARAKLLVLDIPAEHQLRYFADHPAAQPSDICARAGRHGIACLDLLPRVLNHYANAKDSLYVDMAHFNEHGSALITQWTAPWLRAQ